MVVVVVVIACLLDWLIPSSDGLRVLLLLFRMRISNGYLSLLPNFLHEKVRTTVIFFPKSSTNFSLAMKNEKQVSKSKNRIWERTVFGVRTYGTHS